MSFLLSPLAGKRDKFVTIFVWCMCMRPSAQICPDHNLYNNAWISKQYGTDYIYEVFMKIAWQLWLSWQPFMKKFK